MAVEAIQESKVSLDGFVISGEGAQFLSRSRRWVSHATRTCPDGLQRAWVFTEECVREGPKVLFSEDAKKKSWCNGGAVKVYPARYNAEADKTEIMGDPVSLNEFLAAA